MNNNPKAIYDSLYAAYGYFNDELFAGKLPPAVLVLHRKRNAHGYFWAEQWRGRDKKKTKMSEIALNPQTMGRSHEEVLSTLVHEMVHHEQQCFGKPPRGAYHNKEWATMMDAVGLTPTTTGSAGGARTGRAVTHMIEEGGVFEIACKKLLSRKSFSMDWWSPAQTTTKPRDRSKVPHTCEHCKTKVWGKEGIHIVCGDCDVVLQPVW